ncbi:MAG: hypothetical protein KQH63_13515 [Desulfobulbaceae bacterium]|nr:hypothetical protein [Desulfobulbaceae bacterium]
MGLRQEKRQIFREVHHEFAEILQKEKCRTCSCLFEDMMSKILHELQEFRQSWNDSSLLNVEEDFIDWLRIPNSVTLHK